MSMVSSLEKSSSVATVIAFMIWASSLRPPDLLLQVSSSDPRGS